MPSTDRRQHLRERSSLAPADSPWAFSEGLLGTDPNCCPTSQQPYQPPQRSRAPTTMYAALSSTARGFAVLSLLVLASEVDAAAFEVRSGKGANPT